MYTCNNRRGTCDWSLLARLLTDEGAVRAWWALRSRNKVHSNRFLVAYGVIAVIAACSQR